MRTRQCLIVAATLLLATMLLSAVIPTTAGAQDGGAFGENNGGSMLPGAFPSSYWYFAAGNASAGYSTYLDIFNPGTSQANVEVDFLTAGGLVSGPALTVAPHRSKTVDAGSAASVDGFGMQVASSQPVVAQRTICGEGRIETNLGATALSISFYFAEGWTGAGWQEWIDLVNPGGTPVNCTVKCMNAYGSVHTVNKSIAAGARATVDVNDVMGSDDDVMVEVTSPLPIYAEETMWFDSYGTTDNPGMHIAPGAMATSSDWYFPAVTTREGFDAWLATWNATAGPVNVDVDFLIADQSPMHFSFTVPAMARYTNGVETIIGEGKTAAIHVHADSPVACELAGYFSYDSGYLEGECDGAGILQGFGVTATTFHLPGGSVDTRHEQWINLANFGGSALTVNLKAYTSEGTVNRAYSVSANRSRIVNVNQGILAEGEIYGMELTSAGLFLAGKSDFYSASAVPKPPEANYTWYFAEGCTREGFSEWLCLQNPGDRQITVYAKYMLFGADPVERSYAVDANSRFSINVNEAVGGGQDVSVFLWSEYEFYAERPMYFDYKPGQPGYSWDGGHVTFGVEEPRTDWYFAEGCTRAGFEEWICIQNPTNASADVYVDYITAGAPTTQKYYPIPANSRFSVNVNADVGPGQDVSAYVHSATPIVCERPMYFSYSPLYNSGPWEGGHVVMGTSSPKLVWYFAEGCTRPGFEEWICIQNPNPSAAFITATYATTGGVIEKEFEVPAHSRHTINVNDEAGQDRDVACVIATSSTQTPIICERPLYFNYTGYGAPGWNGGSAELGAAWDDLQIGRNDWYFAEGYTGPGFHEFICIQTIGLTEGATITVTYNIQGGQPIQKEHTIPPGRYTIFVNDDAGLGLSHSTQVSSDRPIIAERSMYFDYGGWSDGHCALGYAP